MTKLTGFLIGLLVASLTVLYCERAQAVDIHVSHNGTEQFCAANLASINNGVWDFSGTCQSVPPPPPPSGRITTSNVAYNGCSTCLNRFVGVTEWSAIWGHATDSDTETPFPGRASSAPVILNFRRTGYIAAHFKPTATGPRYGSITHTEYNYGLDLTWAISTVAGDFNPASQICKGATSSGQPVGLWTTAPNTYHGKCAVTPGVDYYLNIKFSDPTQGSTTCGPNQAQCAIGTANSYGG